MKIATKSKLVNPVRRSNEGLNQEDVQQLLDTLAGDDLFVARQAFNCLYGLVCSKELDPQMTISRCVAQVAVCENVSQIILLVGKILLDENNVNVDKKQNYLQHPFVQVLLNKPQSGKTIVSVVKEMFFVLLQEFDIGEEKNLAAIFPMIQPFADFVLTSPQINDESLWMALVDMLLDISRLFLPVHQKVSLSVFQYLLNMLKWLKKDSVDLIAWLTKNLVVWYLENSCYLGKGKLTLLILDF